MLILQNRASDVLAVIRFSDSSKIGVEIDSKGLIAAFPCNLDELLGVPRLYVCAPVFCTYSIKVGCHLFLVGIITVRVWSEHENLWINELHCYSSSASAASSAASISHSMSTFPSSIPTYVSITLVLQYSSSLVYPSALT